jgi:hypothetical protein
MNQRQLHSLSYQCYSLSFLSVSSAKFCSRCLPPHNTDSSISVSNNSWTTRINCGVPHYAISYNAHFILLVSFLCVFHKEWNVSIHDHGYSMLLLCMPEATVPLLTIECMSSCFTMHSVEPVSRDRPCVMSERNVISLCYHKDAFFGFVFLSPRIIYSEPQLSPQRVLPRTV